MCLYVRLILLAIQISSFFQASVDTENSPEIYLNNNETHYDLRIAGKLETTPTIIGQINNVLMDKKKINKTTIIFNYKLIYYSPLLISYNTLSLSVNPQTLVDAAEDLFTVNVSSGDVQMSIPRDKPALQYLCQEKKLCSCVTCIFTLNFIYSTQNKINSDTIRVLVEDINESKPVFTHSEPLVLNISEASQIGSTFKLKGFKAFDSDAFFNKITYFLNDWSLNENNFNEVDFSSDLLEIQSVNESSGEMNLILKKHLDYELAKSYEIFLIAQDNGSPKSLVNTKTLKVNILDDNDNSPVCDQSLFIATINENLNKSNFLQIKATDIDSGLNSQLQYFILSSLNAHNLFSIDQNTGWLSLNEPLNYETKPFYELNVEVRDSGLTKVLLTRCAVRVNVLDLNDSPAKIKIIQYLDETKEKKHYSFNTMSGISSESGLNTIKVYENNKPNLVLALIKIFDSDVLSNYKFFISSVANGIQDTSMFEIKMRSTREFELITTGVFDAETVQDYRLKIALYDLQALNKNDNALITQQQGSFFQVNLIVNVQILDENDNGPEFGLRFYNYSILENTLNIKLPSIRLLDKDVTVNSSSLSFKINSNSYVDRHVYLFYEQDTLNLVVQNSFDYEEDGGLIEFSITMSDGLMRNDTCEVRIHVIDQNDNMPQIMNANETFSIKENSIANSFVGQVIAVDRDSSGTNSDVSFRLVGSKEINSLFKIYKSGVIFSNEVTFDRETEEYYTLQVEAYNSGYENSSIVGNFYVRIIDENDNKPHFIKPGENVKYLSIDKMNSYKGKDCSSLFKAKADDLDTGLNGRVEYFIYESSGSLSIDRHDGTVFLDHQWNASNLERECKKKRVLEVRMVARDMGKPQLERDLNLTIYLNYEAGEIPMSVLKGLHSSEMLKSGQNLTDFEKRTRLKKKWSILEMIYNDTTIIIILSIFLAFMVFFTSYVLVVTFRRSRCIKGKYETKNKYNKTNKASCFKSNAKERKVYNLTVKDASISEFSKSMVSGINQNELDNRLSLKFKADPKVTSVFEPDYLNDFYSRMLFRQSTSDVFDNTSRKSDSDLSIDILNELYIDSQKMKNYENVKISGREIYEKNLMIDSKLDYLVDGLENKNNDSSYLYPTLVINNSKNNNGTRNTEPELKACNLDLSSSFMQTSNNQILLGNSYKNSSDEMLKNLLEKFEVIYNDSVIQNKNLGVHLTNMDESLNTSHLIN